jgi:large-conductance mechanosensitive channel
MEIKDTSSGMFIWQIVTLLILVLVLFFVIKLYRKFMKYLDGKSQNKP